MIQAKIQEAKQTMEQMQSQGQAPPMAGNMGAMMDMYSGLLNTLMQETQSASLSLDPSATALRLELAVAAVPQTEMAKVLAGDPATVGPLVREVPPERGHDELPRGGGAGHVE